eukprot:CAMPEP_0170803432 /NCGR_PEP_ID=MMETSP0733-20121128/30035_1 /TAXON_ID=186038 /ORGANISM="Fragilariopsis kerguelensis, Strain L26-C5" /LENGTH=61 /DNA_ID=CAMNT_0011157149 /DNA_START=764 /DNA_END=946 /DNA_ORIENTATION=-
MALELKSSGLESYQSKPNWVRPNQGPVCPPQNPSPPNVAQKGLIHLMDHGMFDLAAENNPS